MLTPRRNRLSPDLVDQLTRIAFNAAQLRRPDPVTLFSRSLTELKLRAFFCPQGGEEGIGMGEDGGDIGAGVDEEAVGGAGDDGDGLWEEEEEEPLPDLGAWDVDAIVAELLS